MPREFKVVERELIYEDQWAKFHKLHITRDGVPGTYTCLTRSNSIFVLPVSPTGRTVLIRQFRFAPEREMWEICAGGIDAGEDPAAAAVRELREETGLIVDHVEHLATAYPFSSMSDNSTTIYLAHVTDAQLDAVKTPEDMDEIIELRTFTMDQIDDMAARGEFTCGLSQMVLYHYHRNLRQTQGNRHVIQG